MGEILPALLISLLGCGVGISLVFIDQIAIFLYGVTLKKYLVQKGSYFPKSGKGSLVILLAAIFSIAAFFLIAIPAAGVLLLIRQIFEKPEPVLSELVRSLLRFSPLVGMALGVILRRKSKCKTWGE